MASLRCFTAPWYIPFDMDHRLMQGSNSLAHHVNWGNAHAVFGITENPMISIFSLIHTEHSVESHPLAWPTFSVMAFGSQVENPFMLNCQQCKVDFLPKQKPVKTVNLWLLRLNYDDDTEALTPGHFLLSLLCMLLAFVSISCTPFLAKVVQWICHYSLTIHQD